MSKALQDKIGYWFQNRQLLQTALTHTSYANESRDKCDSNERLEFLGDSVLSVIASEYLFNQHPAMPEGQLTRQRSTLVCEPALSGFAKEIQLGDYLLLGKGEEMSGGRGRDSILSDAFEALIAALYLDGGLYAAEDFVLPFLERGSSTGRDYKTWLQEVVQQNPEEQLTYRLAEETGPDHAKTFTVEVLLNTNRIGLGSGHSKKIAEQQAARQALELMGLVPREKKR